ncbi:beta/alpha barrel domain-containing protein [Plastoroseomonas hellenica]|uniref:dihydroorotate dehydrogenase n=1 Tax=Plastoroseomonas hellenica TaxID=2687306 RepID=UPI003461B494
MTGRLETRIGGLGLKNPVIAAAAEHMIEAEGVRATIAAGAGAVVVKSANESAAARDQLQRAEYIALDAAWNPVPWGPDAPPEVTLATRSGLTPQDFDHWLEQNVTLDRLARQQDCLLVASLVLADIDAALGLARRIEQAGLRALEFNIGTPYASQAVKGAVSTELSPERVGTLVAAMRGAVSLPLWVKLTGQSERVPELAEAALGAGADAVVMAGRLLGMVPDLDSMAPVLGTSLGIGGYWNLPLTCHWLALSRARLGAEAPLIGINGARDGRDVARMLLAGAHAVGIASPVMLRGPQVLSEALRQLDDYLGSRGLTVAGIIGRAADSRRSFAEMPLRPDNWRNYVTPGSGS